MHDEAYRFYLTQNCKLEQRIGENFDQVIWSSGNAPCTDAGEEEVYLEMGNDGKLRIRDQGGQVVWTNKALI